MAAAIDSDMEFASRIEPKHCSSRTAASEWTIPPCPPPPSSPCTLCSSVDGRIINHQQEIMEAPLTPCLFLAWNTGLPFGFQSFFPANSISGEFRYTCCFISNLSRVVSTNYLGS